MNTQKYVLGIDIGNVITAGGNEVFTPKFLEGPAMEGAFETIQKLVAHFGRSQVWLVSKCGAQTEERTKQWLEHHGFYEFTGVAKGHVQFCRERHEKAPICLQLGITHFIDDRLEVLSHMTKLHPPMEKLYLFKPQPKEVQKFNEFLPCVTQVESWKEIADDILPRDYSRFLIREYPLWSVYAHENQGYLGRCYIWCKRQDAMDFPDATEAEVLELRNIAKAIEIGLGLAFKPTKLNYAMLGNVSRHLHMHVIPRYEQPVEFAGVTFKDNRWGQNYLTDRSFETYPWLLDKIISRMKQYIS